LSLLLALSFLSGCATEGGGEKEAGGSFAMEGDNADVEVSRYVDAKEAGNDPADQDYNVNAKNKDGATPLMVSAFRGELEMTQVFLTKGSDVNATDNFGNTALLLAAKNGHNEIVSLLKEYGANTSKGLSPVMAVNSAIMEGDLAGLTALLDKKEADLGAKDENGWTPLMLSVNYGKPEIVKLLIDRGSDPNTTDNDGTSALTRAVLNCNLDIMKILLDRGATTNSADNLGWTPLMHASSNCGPEPVVVLLDKGADVNARGNDDETALMAAVSNNANKEVAKTLISRGADVNAHTKEGDTALKTAIEKGNSEMAEMLKAAGEKE